MPRSWIEKRDTKSDGVRFLVRFRLGGRASVPKLAGTFRTKREAEKRKAWVLGELANMRVPDVRLVAPEPGPTLTVMAERWRTSRLDVSTGTAATHRVNLGRILPTLGTKLVEDLQPADVAGLVVYLHGEKLARESIRKTIATLAMVLDFAKVTPNPARDKDVKLPREDKTEVNPPTASHVEAVCTILPRSFRLRAEEHAGENLDRSA